MWINEISPKYFYNKVILDIMQKNEVDLRVSLATKVEMAYSPCAKFSSRTA